MTDWKLRPARDLDLTLAARLRSHRRETGLLGLAGNELWRLALRGYLAAAHRLEVSGAEQLPHAGRLRVLACDTAPAATGQAAAADRRAVAFRRCGKRPRGLEAGGACGRVGSARARKMSCIPSSSRHYRPALPIPLCATGARRPTIATFLKPEIPMVHR
jgi:hypothetical protein